jgi:hypothetical protein
MFNSTITFLHPHLKSKNNILGAGIFCLMLVILQLLPSMVVAQRIQISGWVTDESSGEQLVGASCMLIGESSGTSTDNYGFFSLYKGYGKTLLVVSYFGFKSDTISVLLQRDTVLRVNLSPYVLKTVEITAASAQSTSDIGVLNIPVEVLKSRPVLFGEPDVIKSLTLTPGVKSGTEGTTGLYIRGGTPDQNLMLLDGATVYNNSHLFGFISVFNPDAVKSVTLYKSPMPARYGGRLSSVVDISMKEGNNQKRRSIFSLGVISSRFLTEGAFKKGKSSYLFSARSSYLGLLALPSKIKYRQNASGQYVNYWMYDLNGKVNFDLGKNRRLYFSYYTGRDYYNAFSKTKASNGQFGLNWGNQTMSSRYSQFIGQKVFWVAQITYNKYRYTVDQRTKLEEAPTSRFINSSYIQDWSMNHTFKWSPFPRHDIEMGSVLTRQAVRPQFQRNDQGGSSSSLTTIYKGTISTVFAEDQFRFHDRGRLIGGIRASLFNTGGTTYRFLEPRTRLQWSLLPNTKLELGWRYNKQPIHLLSANTLGLNNDIWVPATKTIRPASGEQWTLGTQVTKKRLKSVFSLETYYRSMNNLLDFKQGFNLFNIDKNWEDVVATGGQGRAFGVEFMAHKQTGALTGWVSYTLGWNERRFSQINQGNWYPHQYDRRHEVSVTASYPLSERWVMASNFVFSSGNAFTAPSYFIVVDQNLDGNIGTPIYTTRNNRRGPFYHRMDLSLEKNYTSKKGRATTFSFGVYNIYARRNPFYLSTSTGYVDGKSAYIRYQVGSVFNFIPSINYGFTF